VTLPIFMTLANEFFFLKGSGTNIQIWCVIILVVHTILKS